MSTDDWVTVIPGADTAQVARDLLSLADNPHQVRTNTDHGLTFHVPQDLAARYAQLLAEVTTPAAPTPAPKRRGRPRKETP